MLIYFLITVLLAGYFIYKDRTTLEMDQFVFLKPLYLAVGLTIANLVIALIYVYSSLIGGVIFRTNNNGFGKIIWDTIRTTIGILLLMLLVPAPGIVLCAIRTRFKDSLIKRILVGIVVFALSIVAIVVFNHKWMELHLSSLFISCAATIQAAISLYWSISIFLKNENEEVSTTEDNDSIVVAIKLTINEIVNYYRREISSAENNILRIDQIKSIIKPVHLILMQLGTFTISLISSLHHRTVYLEQVAYKSRSYVSGISWTAVIIPALVVFIWLIYPQKKKLFSIMKFFIIAEIVFGLACVCTWQNSAYIRLFGAYSWIYSILAIISASANNIFYKGDAIYNDEILIKKYAAQIDGKVTSNSTVQNIRLKANRLKSSLSNTRNIVKKSKISIEQKKEIKRIAAFIMKCCFGLALLSILFIVVGVLVRIKLSSEYKSLVGLKARGGYLAEWLDVTELKMLLGDWAQIGIPFSRFIPEFIFAGVMLASIGIQLKNFINGETRPIIVGWGLLALSAYGAQSFANMVNDNYASWIASRTQLFRLLADNPRFWSQHIMNEGRAEGFFYGRNGLFEIICIFYIILLSSSLIMWGLSALQKQKIASIEALERAWPSSIQKEEEQITENPDSEDACIENDKIINENVIPLQELYEALHNVKESKDMEEKREINIPLKKIGLYTVLAVALILFVVLLSQPKSMTYDRFYGAYDGSYYYSLQLNADSSYRLLAAWNSIRGEYKAYGDDLILLPPENTIGGEMLKCEITEDYVFIPGDQDDGLSLYRDMDQETATEYYRNTGK